MEKKSDCIRGSRGLPTASSGGPAQQPTTVAEWLKWYNEEFNFDSADYNSEAGGPQQQPYCPEKENNRCPHHVQSREKLPEILQRFQEGGRSLNMVLSPRRALRALKGLKYSALLLCFIVILLPTPTMGTADPTPNDASTQPSWLNQLPFQFAAPVFQIVPWIINALQVQYRNMEQVAVLAV